LPDKAIRAVLFDLGETLLNFGRVNTASVFRQGAKLTYDFLKSCSQPVGSFWWYHIHSILAVRLRCAWANIGGRDFDALSLLRRIGRRRGFTLSDEQWRRLGWLWYEPLSKLASVEPGLKQTLGALKQLGLKLGIVSNTFISAASLDTHLAQFGILEFLPVRLYSCQLDFRKPDLRMFRVAAECLGISPGEVLFVGDRINVDIRPAMRAGMHVVLKRAYTNRGKTPPAGVEVVESISEIPGIVRKVNAEGQAAEQFQPAAAS
jgi:HAD superfamily hydrolase (TIGR01509 family)